MLCLSPAKGGLEMLAADTVRTIAPFSFAIVLENSWIAKDLQQNATILFRAKKPSKVPLLLATQIAQWIIEMNIDLIHIHWTKDLLLAVLIKKILAKKKVFIKLAVSRHMSLSRSKKDAYHRWLYLSVDAYISVCDFVHQQAKQRLPVELKRLHHIYPGVNATPQTITSPFATNNHRYNLIILGRIEPNKGQYLMLQALATLNNPDIHCHFVGHAMDDDYVAEITGLSHELAVANAVTFHGFIAEPAQYLSHFNALVLTTHCETLGLVLIEAMQAGIVTLGSRCGGVVEIIEHKKTGLLFESKNADDLAMQLQWLIDNPKESKQLALAGKKKAEHCFNKEKNDRKLHSVLENIG